MPRIPLGAKTSPTSPTSPALPDIASLLEIFEHEPRLRNPHPLAPGELKRLREVAQGIRAGKGYRAALKAVEGVLAVWIARRKDHRPYRRVRALAVLRAMLTHARRGDVAWTWRCVDVLQRVVMSELRDPVREIDPNTLRHVWNSHRYDG